MALYWRIDSIPELADMPRDVRSMVFMRARRTARLAGDLRWVLLGVVAMSFVLSIVPGLLMTDLVLGGLALAYGGTAVQYVLHLILAVILYAVIFTWCLGLASLVLQPWIIARTRPHIRELLTAGL